MLFLFELERLLRVGYDEVRSFVIVAASEDEARRMAADEAGDEGHYTWVDDRLTSCVSIGTAYDEVRSIVVRSFNAG